MTFYEEVAAILGVNFVDNSFPWYKRTRWNNRSPGNGRYEGYGIVRKFGDKVHVALRHPVVCHQIFDSEQKALDFLRAIV